MFKQEGIPKNLSFLDYLWHLLDLPLMKFFCTMTLKNEGVFSLIKSYLTNTQRHLYSI